MKLMSDNQAVLHFAYNPVFHYYHFVREKVLSRYYYRLCYLQPDLPKYLLSS